MRESEKRDAYREAAAEIAGLIDGLDDAVAAMASACAVLHARLPYASWTGFYRVVAEDLLRIGPYQGPVGCLEIRFGEGVCGVAAQRRQAQIVRDVHRFPGHIACDPRARSEIVVPVFDPAERLAAVLDVDSHQPGAFDELDRSGLERVAALLAPSFGG